MTDSVTPHIPSDDEIRAARSELEATLAGADIDLSDAALWEPPPDLEETIMAGISVPEIQDQRTQRRWIMTAAAAVIGIAAIGAVAVAAVRADTPDWTVALAATDLAPNATASIDGWNEASGTRIRLDIDDLPPAPEGFFYELWFSDGPVHISAGTFRETQGVEMWAGVTRAEFPRLWITLEPIDDNESPSPDTVLDTN